MTALEALGVRKTYGGVVALDDATFTVRPGSVHALLGENGAGKSTLVKVMTGAIRPDAGTLRLGGQEVRFSNTADAVRHGVAVVAQELSLFPHLDILSNLFPMREPRRGSARRPPADAGDRPAGPRVPGRDASTVGPRGFAEPRRPSARGDRQGAGREAAVLLLDEPTSALETGASQQLLGILRVSREADVGVVYVSHILEEVMSLCDEVTVLRDGRVVMAAEPLANLTLPLIVDAMLGDRIGLPREVASTPRTAAATDIAGVQGAPAVALPSRAIAAAAAPGSGAANEVVVDRVSHAVRVVRCEPACARGRGGRPRGVGRLGAPVSARRHRRARAGRVGGGHAARWPSEADLVPPGHRPWRRLRVGRSPPPRPDA